jgi:hypothetical protein
MFPTAIENIALSLIFARAGKAGTGESRYNRKYSEYAEIAAALPPLKRLTGSVNRLLREMHRCNGCNGVMLPELCRFKPGDERVTYEKYPQKISYDTIRLALNISGLRTPRRKRAMWL